MEEEFFFIVKSWLTRSLKYLNLPESGKFTLSQEKAFVSQYAIFQTPSINGHRLIFTLIEDFYDVRLPVGVEIRLESRWDGRLFWNSLINQHPHIFKTILEDRIKLSIECPIGFPNEYLKTANRRARQPFDDLKAYFTQDDPEEHLDIQFDVHYMTVGQNIRYALQKLIVLFDSATAGDDYPRENTRILEHYSRIFGKKTS